MNINSRFLRAANQCNYLSEDLKKLQAPLAYIMAARRFQLHLLDMAEDFDKWMNGEDILEDLEQFIGDKNKG